MARYNHKKQVVTHPTKGEVELGQSKWHKSTMSGGGNDCVEVAFVGDTVAVRDTKDRDGGALIFTQSEWRAFLGGVRQGEFD